MYILVQSNNINRKQIRHKRQLSLEAYYLNQLIDYFWSVDALYSCCLFIIVKDKYADFDAFVKRHAAYNPVVEGLDAMKGSYIFVNPQGQLVDNSQGTHAYGLSLLTHSFQEAFAKLNFNQTKYDERYQTKY